MFCVCVCVCIGVGAGKFVWFWKCYKQFKDKGSLMENKINYTREKSLKLQHTHESCTYAIYTHKYMKYHSIGLDLSEEE